LITVLVYTNFFITSIEFGTLAKYQSSLDVETLTEKSQTFKTSHRTY